MPATLKRIGWQAISLIHWVTHDGAHLDLAEEVGPLALQGLLRGTAQRRQCKQVASHEGPEHLERCIHLDANSQRLERGPGTPFRVLLEPWGVCVAFRFAEQRDDAQGRGPGQR